MSIKDSILRQLPFEPTVEQAQLAEKWGKFILNPNPHKLIFVLRGYAGTGKTSMLAALVRSMRLQGQNIVLMAPTGRAAKVMSVYAQKKAYTIHKRIYKLSETKEKKLYFERQKNKSSNTIFVVDEASMISDDASIGGKSLLNDVISFVFQQPDSKNKLIFVGDIAQLPPVHFTQSPALDASYLNHHFRSKSDEMTLTEVKRQGIHSGILYNATTLRNNLQRSSIEIEFVTKQFKDIYRMTSEKLEDGLRYAYEKYGVEETAIICRSNRNAVQFNKYIRHQIHYRTEEVEAGDYLMIVKNNYNWLAEDSPAGFLANGEFVEVTKVLGFSDMHGFRYADLSLRLLDYPKHEEIEAKVCLDVLHSFTPALSQEEYERMREAVAEDYADLSRKKMIEEMRKDKFLNALQVKYAYSLTCHKSQGGQWSAVFVDQGYLTEEMLNEDYLRWLYTALTRAKKELFLVNFHSKFFKQKQLDFEEE